MKRTPKFRSAIELLESRIAPAGLILIATSGKSATWTDIDGSKVTLTISKGALTQGIFLADQTPETGLLVTKLDLTDDQFKGANVILTAKTDPLVGGDNAVNIGYINAQGNALGMVSIAGDLGRIDAGDPGIAQGTPTALKSLTVHSMGILDGASLPADVTQTSELIGKVGAVKVRGSVKGVLFNVSGGLASGAAGSITSLFIGGSLVGNDDADSGRFTTSGAIGAITIGGSIIGSAGQHSGSIEAGGLIKSVKVGGSIFGGQSDNPSTEGTGVVRSEQNIGAVTVVGSIYGGTQQNSGLISSAGNLGAVKISGGIVGGTAGTSSGGVFVGGNVTSISIKGDVLGGFANNSGVIHVEGKAGSILLSGALTGGEGTGSGAIYLGTDSADFVGKLTIKRDLNGGSGLESGRVTATGKLGAVKIDGSIHGGDGDESGQLILGAGAASILIGGDISGSTGEEAGRIEASAAIGAFSLVGNLLGGTADHSGSIFTSDAIAKLTITGSIIGANLTDDASQDLTGSGLIQAGRIGALTIGSAIRVGEDHSALFSLVNNAAIRVQNDIGLFSVKGSIEGTEETPAVITARGQASLTVDQTTDIAFAGINVGGTVRNALILAGYNTIADHTLAEANPNAQIGAVTINGDWIASDLVAGVSWNDNFGDGTDVKAAGVDIPEIVASIASVVVKGQVVGTGDITDDRFAFVAQHVEAMKIGTTSIQLNTEKSNDNDPELLRYNLAGTVDVRIFEVP